MTNSRGDNLAAVDFRKKYQVLAKLGEGGMAFVHLAVVRGVEGVRKLVVLKSVRPELVADSRARSMFIAEARLAATFNHPNIVHTFEVVVLQDRPVMVMEYLEGQPFSHVVWRSSGDALSLDLKLHVIKEVLDGLEYVHNFSDLDGTPLNLVHRDISPQNVIVMYDGHIKVLDFGVAKIVGSTGHTETGEIRGKIRYMAPEQMVVSSGLDKRADLFSVGVMLWEAVTGRRLWEGMSDVQVIQRVVEAEMPAPSTVVENVSPELDAICRRALAHDPEDRYESAAAMLRDLEDAIERLGLQTSPRQVGKAISEAFADVRSSIKGIVEAQLRDKAAPINLVISEGEAVTQALEPLSGDLTELPPAVSGGQSQADAARRRRAASVLGGGLVLGAVCALAVVRHFTSAATRERSLANHAAAVDSATSGAAAAAQAGSTIDRSIAAPRYVSVAITVSPAHAELFLDDVPVASAPFAGSMKADSNTHTLRAEARGYRPKSLALALDGPVDTQIALEPLVVVRSVPPAAVALTASTRQQAIADTSAAASASSAAPLPCSVPYHFDEKGIKRLRPECFK